MKCAQCNEKATVVFKWPTSMGEQQAPLCPDDAANWWRQYQHTPAGHGLKIEGLGKGAELA